MPTMELALDLAVSVIRSKAAIRLLTGLPKVLAGKLLILDQASSQGDLHMEQSPGLDCMSF